MRTVKQLCSKTSDPYLSSLICKATPLENDFTPSELLIGRLLKTTLPSIPDNRLLQKPLDIAEMEQLINKKTMENYNRQHRVHQLPGLSQGSHVYIRNTKKSGTILRSTTPRSYTVKIESGVVRQNRSAVVDLRKDDPEVSKPNVPSPVPKGAEVLDPNVKREANPSGTQTPGLLVAEGMGLHPTHPASPAVPGRSGALARERRLPSYPVTSCSRMANVNT